MARGYPDFFGYSIFPQYGSHNQAVFNDTIPAAGVHNLITVNGKGVLQSGYVEIWNGTDLIYNTLYIEVDGQPYTDLSLYILLEGNFTKLLEYPFTLLKYDIEHNDFYVAINGVISFTQSLVIDYNMNVASSSHNVYAEINYAILS